MATGFQGVSTQSSNLGRIDFGLNMSLYEQADFKSLPSVATLNFDGYFGVNTGTPYLKTRFTQRASWTFSDFTLGYIWRFIGKSKVLPRPVFRPAYSSIKDYNYVDLNGSWQITKNFKAAVTISRSAAATRSA